MEYDLNIWHKIMYNFQPYNVLLSIATNIPVLLMTHMFIICIHGSDLFIFLVSACSRCNM